MTYTPLSFLLAGVIGRQEGMSTITQAAYVSNPIRTGNRTLQPLPGASRSEASGVNYDGTVIVGWGAPSTTGVHAVLWRKNSSGTFVIEDLGVLHEDDNAFSSARKADSDGNVVVGLSAIYDRVERKFEKHAFYWMDGEGMKDLNEDR